ncbi:MAG TPA: hypothetical protein VN026_18360 [Bacteroidia bacterium]|jgi:hypothetical protein|nr:hypothetical protein [Bacteroidia bacterium]
MILFLLSNYALFKLEIQKCQIIQIYPKATRPLEFVVFLIAELRLKTDITFMYLAIDEYTQTVFHTGVENDDKPETVLKHVYMLTEHPDFLTDPNSTFTLVLHKYKELSDRINSIISPLGGTLLVDEKFHNHLVLQSS